MAAIGFAFLVVGLCGAIAAAFCLFASAALKRGFLVRAGGLLLVASSAAFFACCGVLVACFVSGDVSILYVLENRSLSVDGMAWLYRLSGLWAGRAGSLLFWTFLISLFGVLIFARSARARGRGEDAVALLVDSLAMGIVAVIVAVFCGVLLFSGENMPFEATPAAYFTSDGALEPLAAGYSMNQLLEHWAMAIHPPLLFVGYAGLTVPFAYAIAALVANDASKTWIERSTRFTIASWLFLGAGIGLGAVWAYVVLGWGGYWGWDPVENASLLPWLACVALVHTFTVYRQRGAFKRWAVMCACLAFTFVVVATFITRSGIVQSVHAFAGDSISLALFGGLIAASLVVSIAGLVFRWKTFAPDVEGRDDVEHMFSKDAAYYFNNVIMMAFALLLAYMTLTSALPAWMPFGGDSLGTSAYEAIARPLGIVYLLILAVCPLLAWGKTDSRAFLRNARVPAACAVALFAVLVFWWATRLAPLYDAAMAKADAHAETLLEAGPGWYYNALAVAGLFTASLLFFNAAFMFVRGLRARSKRGPAIGGALAHTAMAIALVGLIGSSMFVFEESGYLDGEEGSSLEVLEYELVHAGNSVTDNTDENGMVLYEVSFDVYKSGAYVGQATPSVQLDTSTQQQKLNAAVVGFPEEDLFIVYRGVNDEGAFSLDVRVNPLISLVWTGFALLMLGTFCALVMPRGKKRAERPGATADAGDAEGSERPGAAADSGDAESAERPGTAEGRSGDADRDAPDACEKTADVGNVAR